MGNIPRFIGDNIGSVVKIEGAPVQAFATFPYHKAITVSETAITFRPNCGWWEINCSQQSMGYQQDGSDGTNGTSYTQQVVGFVPGDEPAIEQQLQAFREYEWILKITLASGRQKIIGSPNEPLILATRGNTGTAPETAPGNQLTWSGESLYRSPHLI